jgi:NADPH:quinone reductase-like Zn-dependent oxidoreductase
VEVYATVGSDEKRRALHEQFDIPCERIFDSNGAEFLNGIAVATSGQGVDVVLGTAAGEVFHETLRCIKPGGRFIELGGSDIIEHGQLDLHLLRQNISFSAVDMSLMISEKALLGKLNG